MNRFLLTRQMAFAMAALAVLSVSAWVSAAQPTAPVWSFVVTTAPGLPQDVWFAANGNNTDGWRGGGCLCLGPLAQGAGPTQHATVLLDVYSAGILGIDGTPVPPGTYLLPGGQLLTDGRLGPAELQPPREYTLTSGETFFIAMDAELIESNFPQLPKGTKVKFMLTFDFDPLDPDSYGNRTRYVAAWADFSGTGNFFFPFRSE